MAPPLDNLLYLLAFALCGTRAATRQPTVALDGATFFGISDGVINQFLGIPFAQPPVGKLRLRLPHPVEPYHGVVNATEYGFQCLQQALAVPLLPDNLPPEIIAFLEASLVGEEMGPPHSEDCLNINVVVPAGTPPDAKLPVAAWIYGGGFQVGSNAQQSGLEVVNRSIELGQPVIFVSMNYRLSAFGFLGGREVKEAGVGNLGLHDQREALRWVQKYIPAFGGDPTKVTIWGESAGSISVASHMLTNGGNTEGLFRAGWMESGSVFPAGDITKLQPTFDFIASEAGCADAPDVLECLREVPAEAISSAMNKTPTVVSYHGVNVPWIPRADGVFLEEPADKLLLSGNVARIPFVSGTNEDEGTLFSLPALNVTTGAEFVVYLRNVWFPDASDGDIERLLELYPADPAAGSPFGTGQQFNFTREYKRMSAFQGDFVFQAPRRLLLEQLSGKQVARSFLSQRNSIPGMGVAHSTELPIIFGGQDMTDFLIRFVNTLDPNSGDQSTTYWPRYTKDRPLLLAFTDGNTSLKVIPDTFRKGPMDFLTQLSLEQPL